MLGEQFTFNNIHSSTFHAKMLRFGSSGFIDETTIGQANVTEIENPSDFMPHLQRVTRTPLEFTKQIALVGRDGMAKKWTERDRRNIFSWLFHDEYKPLIIHDRPDVAYYVIATGDLSLNTINEKGYLDITFKSNSPYPWKKKRQIVTEGSTTGITRGRIRIDLGLALDRLYPIVELERVGTSSSAIVQVWLDDRPADFIGLMNEMIPDVSRIRFNTKYRSITNADTGDPLYQFKGVTGDEFFYLKPGTNEVRVSKGWKATFYIHEPIKY